MATTKVIKDLTEFNPGNPDYVLNATNAVTVINSGGNQYNFNGVYGKFGLRIGTTVLTGIPSTHPFTIMNNGKTSQITISGSDTVSGTAPGGDSYTFYYNTATITVLADFGTISYACSVHGYMGGLNNLVSVYSTAGLKMPKGGSAYAAPPTVAEGMMRNEVGQISEGSVSCMQHFNGTNWKNFVNTVSCTTATCDYPSGAGAIALYQLQSSGVDSCTGTSFDGTVNGSGVSFTSGYFGNAATFDGSNGTSITFPSSLATTLRTASAFGVSLWFKATNSTSTRQVLFHALNDTYILIDIVSGRVEARVEQSNSVMKLVTSTATFSTGTWYNIIWTGNAANGLTLYVNGSVDQTTSWNGTFSTYSDPNYKFNIIGEQGSNISKYTGQIDQLRVYNAALNDSGSTYPSDLQNEIAC